MEKNKDGCCGTCKDTSEVKKDECCNDDCDCDCECGCKSGEDCECSDKSECCSDSKCSDKK